MVTDKKGLRKVVKKWAPVFTKPPDIHYTTLAVFPVRKNAPAHFSQLEIAATHRNKTDIYIHHSSHLWLPHSKSAKGRLNNETQKRQQLWSPIYHYNPLLLSLSLIANIEQLSPGNIISTLLDCSSNPHNSTTTARPASPLEMGKRGLVEHLRS